MSSLLAIRSYSNQLIRFGNRLKETATLPERLKGGRIERLTNYGKHVLGDYKQACKDIYIDSRAAPRKASTYLSLITLAFYLYKTNPNSFKSELVNYQNLMALIGEPIRNRVCYDYLHEITDLHNKRMLQKIDLLFFTLYVRKDYGMDVKIYQANCKYLQPSYLEYLRDRIVDIGIAERWLLMSRKLKDFDVNSDEWSNMSETGAR